MLLTIFGALLLAGQAAPQAKDSLVLKDAPRPEPIGPQSWLSDDDYPPEALAKQIGGITGFLLLVDATGKVTDCRVYETSGFLELDQHTCAVLLKRSKFKPARDAAGVAVVSVYKGSFTWKQFSDSDKALKAMRPEPFGIELSLQKLPRGYERPALLRVHFTEAGKPDSCRAELGSGNAALDKVACEQAMLQAVRPDVRSGGVRPDTRMVQVSVDAPKTP
jgi:hypothetical protein